MSSFLDGDDLDVLRGYVPSPSSRYPASYFKTLSSSSSLSPSAGLGTTSPSPQQPDSYFSDGNHRSSTPSKPTSVSHSSRRTVERISSPSPQKQHVSFSQAPHDDNNNSLISSSHTSEEDRNHEAQQNHHDLFTSSARNRQNDSASKETLANHNSNFFSPQSQFSVAEEIDQEDEDDDNDDDDQNNNDDDDRNDISEIFTNNNNQLDTTQEGIDPTSFRRKYCQKTDIPTKTENMIQRLKQLQTATRNVLLGLDFVTNNANNDATNHRNNYLQDPEEGNQDEDDGDEDEIFSCEIHTNNLPIPPTISIRELNKILSKHHHHHKREDLQAIANYIKKIQLPKISNAARSQLEYLAQHQKDQIVQHQRKVQKAKDVCRKKLLAATEALVVAGRALEKLNFRTNDLSESEMDLESTSRQLSENYKMERKLRQELEAREFAIDHFEALFSSPPTMEARNNLNEAVATSSKVMISARTTRLDFVAFICNNRPMQQAAQWNRVLEKIGIETIGDILILMKYNKRVWEEELLLDEPLLKALICDSVH